ncbi:MAG TPA: isoprenylcysteine carboxylmethyltransferase family protein [Dehalococcoidia bacterium]|nr:isoprenylcysteine carboxylmethyltransferase family protein [Dehalococcoidia bacterium]
MGGKQAFSNLLAETFTHRGDEICYRTNAEQIIFEEGEANLNLWDRCAEFVYRVATGSKGRRVLVTPVVASFYLGLTALFVFASFWVDRWLAFPHFIISSWWSLGLSVPLLIPGCVIMEWTLIAFLRTRGTPVPFNPPPKLITTGLYAYVRNPMLLGLFLLMFGLGILFSSLSLIFIFTPLFILLNVLYVKVIEEKEMEKKFGEEYLEYKRKVPMFIPKLKKQK